MFLRIDFLSQAGVFGDLTAFFQPESRNRRFVLMLFPATVVPPNSLCFAYF
jgi:hypothetical protein